MKLFACLECTKSEDIPKTLHQASNPVIFPLIYFWEAIVNGIVFIWDDLRRYTSNPVNTALPSDSLHARHVTSRVQGGGWHVGTRGGQVLLYHIYCTLSTPPQMSGSRAATCLKNRVWEQTLEIIKNNIQQKHTGQERPPAFGNGRHWHLV